jgi:hypothetical protein
LRHLSAKEMQERMEQPLDSLAVEVALAVQQELQLLERAEALVALVRYLRLLD